MEHIFGLTVFIPPTDAVAVGDSWHRSIQTTVTDVAAKPSFTGIVNIDIIYTLQAVDKNAGVAQIVFKDAHAYRLANDATERYTIRRNRTHSALWSFARNRARAVRSCAQSC